MPELVNRVDLLMSAVYCGGIYALWRIVLTVFYPFVSGSLWQNVLGPPLVAHIPSLGQSEDTSRPSYLPTEPGQPLIMQFGGFFAVSIDDLTHGIRDGLLLGVLYALLPEIWNATVMTLLLFVVLGKWVWRISTSNGAGRTDRVIWAGREVLLYVGAIVALQTAAHMLR